MKFSAHKLTVSFLIICLVVSTLSFFSTVSAYYPLSQCTLSTDVNYYGAGWISPSGSSLKYYYGETVTVYAYTYVGYVFDGWYLNGVYQGKLTSISIAMTQDYTLYAVFSQRTTYLTINTNPNDGGTTTPSEGVWNYSAGSSVTVYEYPASGNTFNGWYLDGIYQGLGTSITFSMFNDHQLSAFFSGNGSVPIPTPSPTPTASPTPTPNPNATAPSLSFYCAGSTTSTGFNVRINGALAINNTGLSGAGVTFSYSATGGVTWHDLAYAITDDNGTFSVVWMPTASGNYVVKGAWAGDAVYRSTTSIQNFSVVPDSSNNMFSVTSNSTLSSLSFDSTTKSLSFSVSGPSGTVGFLEACIPKSLLSDVSNLQVTIDGTTVSYSSFSLGDVWIVTLGYHHSTHSVAMSIQTVATASPTPASNPTSNSGSSGSSSNSGSSSHSSSTSSATQSPTSTPSIPELSPLVVLPLVAVMLGLAIFAVTKKRTKKTNQ